MPSGPSARPLVIAARLRAERVGLEQRRPRSCCATLNAVASHAPIPSNCNQPTLQRCMVARAAQDIHSALPGGSTPAFSSDARRSSPCYATTRPGPQLPEPIPEKCANWCAPQPLGSVHDFDSCRFMTSIQADIDGLSALGASCQRHADTIRTANVTPTVGRPFQATSAAVADVHATADAVEARFAERLLATGHKVAAIAGGFAATESGSAALLAAPAQK